MVKNQANKDLFPVETGILQSALRDILCDDYQDNPLLPSYQQLATNYRKLLNMAGKIIKISDIQQWEIKRNEAALKALLNNAGQGFLTFGRNLLVDREYSTECRKIFNRPIENTSIIELLSNPENEEQTQLFKKIFNDIWQIENEAAGYDILQQLPKLLLIHNRSIKVEYKLINRFSAEKEQKVVMLILTDFTEKQAADAQISYLSYHDKLTGLYNRAYIESVMPEFDTEQELPVSLIMADINGLKLTNDVFGHVAGDSLLSNVASILSSCCRQSDIIARWGGDEFLIILPRTNNEVCEAICQRIRQACQEADAYPIEVSLALGNTTRRNLHEDILNMFIQAENLMYHNKLLESQNHRRSIVLNLEKKLWTRGDESQEHTRRMAQMSAHLANNMEIAMNEKEDLLRLVQLHDIGKIIIPIEIMEKPEPLGSEEWDIVRKHCEVGYRMAQAINEPRVAEAILAHHEH
ncbi:MAG: diguanylate cyclase, partial [Syntrophomonas sp.]|nr:diguanylate cyclase [Syntrophomonas sp.]